MNDVGYDHAVTDDLVQDKVMTTANATKSGIKIVAGMATQWLVSQFAASVDDAIDHALRGTRTAVRNAIVDFVQISPAAPSETNPRHRETIFGNSGGRGLRFLCRRRTL